MNTATRLHNILANIAFSYVRIDCDATRKACVVDAQAVLDGEYGNGLTEAGKCQCWLSVLKEARNNGN